MEFFSVILFKKTTVRPDQAVDPEFLKGSLVHWFLSFDIWGKKGL
jgi:hypothetical protein